MSSLYCNIYINKFQNISRLYVLVISTFTISKRKRFIKIYEKIFEISCMYIISNFFECFIEIRYSSCQTGKKFKLDSWILDVFDPFIDLNFYTFFFMKLITNHLKNVKSFLHMYVI